MGSRQGSNAFQEMVDDDRQKKKNEELANQIFGRSKSNQNVRKPQKDTRSLSLASRMGVTKRASSTSVPTQRNSLNPPTRPNSTTPSNRNGRDYTTRNNRIANEIDSGNANVTSRNNSFANNNNNNNTRNTNPPNNNDRRSRQNGPGLSIRGSAGPFTVQLSNFAPGTTEADIESAMQSDMHDADGKDCLQSCRLTSTKPTVVAEMVITERKVADRIVNKFNEMRADGLVLKVKIVRTGAVPSVNGTDDAKTEEPVVEDVEMEQPEHRAYEHEREAADRDRRERERDRDFGRRDERRGEREERRDDRRERDRERERERDRERDSQREREYERRDAPQQLQQQPVYDNRPSGPQQQYGGYERPYGSGFRYGSGRGYGSSRSGYGGRGGGYSRYSR